MSVRPDSFLCKKEKKTETLITRDSPSQMSNMLTREKKLLALENAIKNPELAFLTISFVKENICPDIEKVILIKKQIM